MLNARTSALALVCSLSVTLGCPPEEEPAQNDEGCIDGWHEAYFEQNGRAIPPAEGSLGCDGDDPVEVDPACVQDVEVAGRTVDHQGKDPEDGIDLEVWHSGKSDGDPDQAIDPDADGLFTATMPVCSPIAYRTTRSDGKLTIGDEKILTPGEDGEPAEYDFRNVSESTASLIPSLLGVDPDESAGIVFGKILECGGDDGVANVQVLIRDDKCAYAAPKAVRDGYTQNELPSAFAPATTEDGFFFVMNVPKGDWVVEAFVTDDNGEKFRTIGATPFRIEKGAVTLADIKVGREDGLRVPDECTACE